MFKNQLVRFPKFSNWFSKASSRHLRPITDSGTRLSD